jgi:DNA-binding FrmR family transcriptional regulator
VSDEAVVEYPEVSPTRRRQRANSSRTLPSVDQPNSADPDLSSLPEGARHVFDRLRRIEGQVRGLQRMIVAGDDCESVLTQVMAARAALDRVAGQVVLENLEACFAARSPAAARQKAVRTIQLLARNA